MGLDWLKYRKIQAGRDPLGIQQIGIHLYSKLVPGISNVTDRLRYYSFYPWLLTKYKENKTRLDFVTFIRRAEFLFGFITNYNHRDDKNWSSHAVGGRTINKVIKKIETEGSIDISSYTNLEQSEERYFKNELGGFGQYYMGQLSQIGIIKRKDKYKFSVLPLGVKLAETFASLESQNLFLQCIQNAKVNISILESLHDEFCLCSISKKEDECNILFNILFGADEDFLNQKTFQRRKTLSLLLYLLAQSKETSSKFWHLLNMLYFQRKQNNKPLTIPESLYKISRAWMYYVRHEYFCMGLIAIFIGIQHSIIQGYKSPKQISDYCWNNYIDKSNNADIPEYIKDVFEILKSGLTTNKIIEELKAKYSLESPFSENSINEFHIANEIVGKSDPPGMIFICGVLLIFMSLMQIQKGEDISVDELKETSLFLRYPVNLKRLREDYLKNWYSLTIRELLDEIITKYILHQHIDVAFRKLLQAGIHTFRFMREDGLLCHSGIQIDDVVKTSPRLNQALQMISDLSIIEESKEGFRFKSNSRSEEILIL